MQCQTESLLSSPGSVGVPRHRYKTFMIDEILSDETCKNLEKQSFGSLGQYFIVRLKPEFNRSAQTFHPGICQASKVLRAPTLGVQRMVPLCHFSDSAPPRITPLLSETSCVPLPSGDCPLLPCPGKPPAGLRGRLGSEHGAPRGRKPRRCRTIFSEGQIVGLERKFQRQKYLSTPDRLDVAQSLGLTQLQVKTWYQNRRMKWKKMVLKGGHAAPTKPKGRPRKNSIPTTQEIEAAERLACWVQEDISHRGALPDTGATAGPRDRSPQDIYGQAQTPLAPIPRPVLDMGVGGWGRRPAPPPPAPPSPPSPTLRPFWTACWPQTDIKPKLLSCSGDANGAASRCASREMQGNSAVANVERWAISRTRRTPLLSGWKASYGSVCN